MKSWYKNFVLCVVSLVLLAEFYKRELGLVCNMGIRLAMVKLCICGHCNFTVKKKKKSKAALTWL